MKIIGIKCLLFLIGLTVIAPLFIHGPNGKPIMSLDDWLPHTLIQWSENLLNGLGRWSSDLSSEAPLMPSAPLIDALPQTIAGAGTAIYTWRDSNGVLHFSDTPVEGAALTYIPDDGLAIPADKFIQSGLSPAETTVTNSAGRAFLLEERAFSAHSSSGENPQPTNAASLADIQAVANGDLSKMAAVLKDLPQLIEQAKLARQQTSVD